MKLHELIGYFLFSSVLATMLVFSFQNTLWSQEMTKNRPLPRVGDTAPDFTLQDFGGKSFSLAALKNSKPILLWFTNLCSGYEKKLSEVEKIHNLFQKRRVEMVEIAAVSQLGKDKNTVEDFIQRYKLSFRFLYDPDGKATELYSGKYIQGTCPLKNIFIIQRGGKISYASHLPGVDEKELLSQLERTIKGVRK